MKIYTKTGDNQFTSTILAENVKKSDLIIEVSGNIDETQSAIMVAYNFVINNEVKDLLKNIAEKLFLVGYDIASNKNEISESDISYLENKIDYFSNILPPLNSFILPGVSKSSSFLHLARTIVRRLERSVVEYTLKNKINRFCLMYLNRLSDLLFVMARIEDNNE